MKHKPLVLMFVRHGKPFARNAASRAMVGRNRSRTDPTAGRFTQRDVVGFASHAFDRFKCQVPGLPGEPTVASRQNVMPAALTLSLLEALEVAGVERGYAIELTGDTCWRLYRHWDRTTIATGAGQPRQSRVSFHTTPPAVCA